MELSIEPQVSYSKQFRLVEQIGKGSYGAVYKAVHEKSGVVVALKKQEIYGNLSEIAAEINFMRQCNGPYVVNFYGNSLEDNSMWIVMEYCAFGSVRDICVLLERPFEEDRISLICKFVLRGLEYLHSIGKIHRDIKTDNILVNAKGEPKLADFGVSGDLNNTLKKRKTMIGTPFFLAPEVITNEDGYDAKVDIWSLGVTAIEMAETQPPYADMDPMRVLFMIPTNPAPSLKHKEKWTYQLNDFLARCLIKAPEKRASAKELLSHDFIRMYDGVEYQAKKNLVDDVISELEAFEKKKKLRKENSIGNGINYNSESEVFELQKVEEQKRRLEEELHILRQQLNSEKVKDPKDNKKTKKEKKEDKKAKKDKKEKYKSSGNSRRANTTSSVTNGGNQKSEEKGFFIPFGTWRKGTRRSESSKSNVLGEARTSKPVVVPTTKSQNELVKSKSGNLIIVPPLRPASVSVSASSNRPLVPSSLPNPVIVPSISVPLTSSGKSQISASVPSSPVVNRKSSLSNQPKPPPRSYSDELPTVLSPNFKNNANLVLNHSETFETLNKEEQITYRALDEWIPYYLDKAVKEENVRGILIIARVVKFTVKGEPILPTDIVSVDDIQKCIIHPKDISPPEGEVRKKIDNLQVAVQSAIDDIKNVLDQVRKTIQTSDSPPKTETLSHIATLTSVNRQLKLFEKVKNIYERWEGKLDILISQGSTLADQLTNQIYWIDDEIVSSQEFETVFFAAQVVRVLRKLLDSPLESDKNFEFPSFSISLLPNDAADRMDALKKAIRAVFTVVCTALKSLQEDVQKTLQSKSIEIAVNTTRRMKIIEKLLKNILERFNVDGKQAVEQYKIKEGLLSSYSQEITPISDIREEINTEITKTLELVFQQKSLITFCDSLSEGIWRAQISRNVKKMLALPDLKVDKVEEYIVKPPAIQTATTESDKQKLENLRKLVELSLSQIQESINQLKVTYPSFEEERLPGLLLFLHQVQRVLQ